MVSSDVGFVQNLALNPTANDVMEYHLDYSFVPLALSYLLLDTAVISGNESSRRTCSCSSTK